MNTLHSPPEPTEAEIQHAAYLLWLEGGKVAGHDLNNWLTAKELLHHRHARARASISRAHRARFAPTLTAGPAAARNQNN